jgi:hypothetical protein
MGVEADHYGRPALLVCLGDEMAENILVAEMDPVEVADGDDGAPQSGGDIFAAPDHVHENLFTLSDVIVVRSGADGFMDRLPLF